MYKRAFFLLAALSLLSCSPADGDNGQDNGGGLGEPCVNGACYRGLVCLDNTCQYPPAGTEGGPCFDSGRCDSSLVCVEGRCRKKDFVSHWSVNQNPKSELSAIVNVETSVECSMFVEYSSADGRTRRTGLTDKGLIHRIEVVNMRERTEYLFRLGISAFGESWLTKEEKSFTAGELPEGIPDIEVTIYDQEMMQPGVTLFGLTEKQSTNNGNDANPPAYLGLDETGEVVWYYNSEDDRLQSTRIIRMQTNGNLFISVGGYQYSEITAGGVENWSVKAYELGFDSGFHHDGQRLADGRLFVLVAEVQEREVHWSEEPELVQGDIVLEFNENEEMTWRWSTFDYIDIDRWPDPWTTQYTIPWSGAHPWTHANSVEYIEQQDAVLVSFRHQNWVVKIDRQTSEIIWRLGRDGDFDLVNYDPEAGNDWFIFQHAPEYNAQNNTILIFDNGGSGRMNSRAVMYRLDEDKMEAEQLWSYPVEHFQPGFGDVDRLDNGNVLITAGSPCLPFVCDEPASIIEIVPSHSPEAVWQMDLYGYLIYRSERIPAFYPAE